jgi:hypothetical protein
MSDAHVPRWWRRFKDSYKFILPLRFNLLLLLVLAFALIGTDQGHDIIAHLAEAKWIVPAVFFSLATLALALQVWFWSRQLLYLDLTAREQRDHQFPWWIEWLPRALGFFVFIIVLGACLVIHREPGNLPVRMIRLEVLIAALGVGFFIFTIVRRRFITEKVTDTRGAIRELSMTAKVLYVVTLVLDLIFLAVSFSIRATNFIGAPFILVFAFALWVTFGFFLVWLGHRWEMPLLTLLLLYAIAISPLADNHNVRLLCAATAWLDARRRVSSGHGRSNQEWSQRAKGRSDQIAAEGQMTNWHYAAAVIALWGATLGAGWLIGRNDAQFPNAIVGERRRSAILEWKKQPVEVEEIVGDWRQHEPSISVAKRGLALDTVLFIPLYSSLIAMLCFWAAHVSGADTSTRTVFLALGWCGWIAGAFDLIENTGILAELHGHYFVATPTALVALMKWGLALSVSLAAVGRLLVALVLRR